MQNYNASHRKLSECSHSPAISYYSGTESQQSISDRSFYDNVDPETESRDKVFGRKSSKFLLPPMVALKNSLVNRSKSFQETRQCKKFLSPRSNILIRRNLHESNSIEDRFESISNRSSVSPVGSTQSDTNIVCHSDVRNRKLFQSSDKKSSGPFYIKILRRMQKLSHQWRKCKKAPRGRPLTQWIH